MYKIIFVSQILRGGGAERVVSLLSQEFSKQGHSVKIVLFSKEIGYDFGGEIIDINVKASNNYIKKIFALFKRIKRLRKIFKEEKPDYIFSFMESCNFASILTGYDVVVSIRNNPKIKHTWYQKILIRVLYKFKNVKKVVVVSKGIEKILNDEYGIKNTSVIYNPVDFKNNENVKDLDRFKPFILGIGRLHPQKNFEMLIRAFAKINFDSNLKLIILGEGILRRNLTNLIEALNLQGRVFLPGNVSNVIDYYRQCEFFVLSSLFEGFPNVLIEALSSGCACISTDCPTGPSEIIKDGINGLLVDNNNQASLEDAMSQLLKNSTLRNALQLNSKKSVENLNIKNISKRWLSL